MDSSTALKIIDLLNLKAQKGMAIIATIHQPSNQILQKFDRIIMLSEGYTIYNGAPKDIKVYFEQFGLKMSKFTNPADKMTLIASVP